MLQYISILTGHDDHPTFQLRSQYLIVMPKHEFYTSGKQHFQLTRPKRVIDSKQPTGYRIGTIQDALASPSGGNGNTGSVEYNFLKSDAKSLDEFGLGVSLYFKTLKAFGVIFIVAALISIVAMNENFEYQRSYFGFLPPEGTINCTLSSPDHFENEGEFQPPIVDTPVRLLGSVYGVTRAELSFSAQGISDVMLVLFLVLTVLSSAYVERKAVLQSDANQQTMRDYTVMITNPPEDVIDTKIYYEYFRQFGDVVLISIIPQNGYLFKSLASKVLKEKQLQTIKDTNYGENNASPLWFKRFGEFARSKGILKTIFPSEDSLKQDITQLNTDIASFAEKTTFKPWRVFISFNTESECEKCFNKIGESDFDGYKLNVEDAPEPNLIIYEHSGTAKTIVASRIVLSYVLAMGVNIIAYIIVYFLNLVQGTGISLIVAVVIVCINGVLPFIMKQLTFIFEAHDNREVVQQSILLKLLCSRCIVSALIIYHVTPYGEKFSIQALESIQDIMLADAIVPLFRAVDAYGYFSRYFLAPLFGLSQESFNLFWKGTEYNLAERYANVLKTVFTALFYAVPLPSGLFIASFTLLSIYISDKYLLMHKWRKMPPIGGGLGRLCRFMFVVILFIHCIMSLYFFANWPYRGVCSGDVSQVPNCHLLCDPNSAMTETQRYIVHIYNSFVCAGLVIVVMLVVGWYARNKFCPSIGRKLSRMKVYPDDWTFKASPITLRSIANARAYVPTVKRYMLEHRLICCDVAHLPAPYNYATVNSTEEVSFEPLSLAKLNFPIEVLTKISQASGRVEYFEVKGNESGIGMENFEG